jgi:transposase InsO family protein
MKFAFIAAKVADFSVLSMCRVLDVSPSGYYAWRDSGPSKRKVEDAVLVEDVARIHAASRGAYGSPRVTEELRAQGRPVGQKRIARLMRERGIRGRKKRPFRATTDSSHGLEVPPNLLERNFFRAAPNEAWVGDVTAVHTGTGWLYLAVLIDLFSRAVVAWAVSATNDTALALLALERAVKARRPPRGLIHHTDRGSPYASHEYRAALERHGMQASMSRTGDCWDNAVAESFFASLKGEELDHDWYPSLAAAERAAVDYIERFYNPLRRHSSIGYLSPDEFELRSQVAALAA